MPDADPVPRAGSGRTLVLLRHGRTSWNLEHRAQGQADVPLDEVGLAQAVAVAPLVAGLRPSLLRTSDLARARQTADALARVCGLPVVEDDRLREFDVGERAGLTHAEATARWPDLSRGGSWAEQIAGVPGAESEAQVRARVVPAVEECLGALGAGETGVVVGHGAALKIAVGAFLGWPTGVEATLAVLDNCCWATVVERPGGRRRLSAYGVGATSRATPVGVAGPAAVL